MQMSGGRQQVEQDHGGEDASVPAVVCSGRRNVERVVAEEAGGGGEGVGPGGGDEEERVEGLRSQLGGSTVHS